MTLKEYYETFGDFIHPFTGINMVDFYKELIEKENCQVEFVFSNSPLDILKYTKNVINCDIHTRYKTKEMLDDMHKRKIDMADSIHVINVNGYIGSSTKSEIEYAKLHNKKITYVEN